MPKTVSSAKNITKKANPNITYAALMGEVERLKKQAGFVRNTEVKGIVSKIQQQMRQYNISPQDLGLASADTSTQRKNKPHTRRKAVPKFKDPVTGATWSGRGRTPKWISQAKGKTKQDFAIA